jgi:hypothetical protein
MQEYQDGPSEFQLHDASHDRGRSSADQPKATMQVIRSFCILSSSLIDGTFGDVQSKTSPIRLP